MLVSRKSGPGMKVCPRPGPLAKLQSNLPKGALERFALTPLSAGCRVFGGNVFQIRANHPSESRVTLDGDFPDFFNQFVLKRQCDVHKPIIRESLKPCKRAKSLRDRRDTNRLCASPGRASAHPSCLSFFTSP